MNIFRDKSEMPESRSFPMVEMDTNTAPLVVRSTMVPSESRDGTARIINRSVREPMSVVHVERPRYGHKV